MNQLCADEFADATKKLQLALSFFRSGARMARPQQEFTVVHRRAGVQFVVYADEVLLDAAEMAGVAMPSSCRTGSCRTCMCKTVRGKVSYRIEWPGLSKEEKRDGYILPCVAYPQSDLVIE